MRKIKFRATFRWIKLLQTFRPRPFNFDFADEEESYEVGGGKFDSALVTVLREGRYMEATSRAGTSVEFDFGDKP
jgi:hypothetical protein